MTGTERSPLKPEHPDRAGTAAGGMQSQSSQGQPLLSGVDGPSRAGIAEVQELPSSSLGCSVSCGSPVFTLAASALQCSATGEKKIEKKNQNV